MTKEKRERKRERARERENMLDNDENFVAWGIFLARYTNIIVK